MAVMGEGNYSVTSGSRATSSIAAGRRKPQFEPEVFNISEDVAPMMRLLEAMRQTRDVGSMTFNNMTDDRLPQTVTHEAATSGAGTTPINLASGHGARVQKGTVLQVPRLGLEMLVTAAPAADAVAVTRPYGSTSDGTIASGEEIQILGSSATEGDTAPRSLSVEPNILTQYCQEFRTALQVTDRAQVQETYGPDEWQRCWDKTMEAHLLKIEKQLKLGVGINAADPFETGGLLHWISTNKFTVGGTLTEDSLNSYIEQWMRRNYGQGGNLAFFAGSILMNCFGKYGRDVLRTSEKTQKLGIAALTYQTVFGELTLIPDSQLSPIGSATTAANLGYQGYGIGVNLATLGLRYLKDNHRKVYPDILKDDRPTSRKAEVAETVGLHIASEVAQMWIQSVTG